jgi:hypothetical protein
VVLPLLAVLLAGCSSSPRNDLLDAVADVTNAANDRDAAELRGALANLRAEIDSQVRDNTLSTDESTRLLTLVQQLEADAALVEQPDASPSPTPSASSASPSPSPSPTPSPSPSPTRSPSPRPSPTEEPEESEEPTEEPEEPEPSDLVPSPMVTSPAAAVDEPAASPSEA